MPKLGESVTEGTIGKWLKKGIARPGDKRLIGRLPVKTLAETQTVVDKIVQYETGPLPGGWNQTVTFVADNTDEAGNFAAAW